MFNKINILRIVQKHLETLKLLGANKPYIPDYILFYLLPLFIPILLFEKISFLKEDVLNAAIAVFSILTGLLLNLLVLLFTVQQKDESNQNERQVKNRKILLSEVYANTSYAILVSLFSVVLSVFGYWDVYWMKYVAGFVVTYLTVHLALTVLMIIKRIFNLLHP